MIRNLLKIESYFQEIVRTKVIKPGDQISELWLAKNANVDIFQLEHISYNFPDLILLKI